MDTNISAPATTPALAQATTTTAPAVSTSAPMTAPTYTSNSSGSGSLSSMFRNLDLIQVGFGVLASATLYYALYYYRYNVNQSKAFALNIQNRLDELDIKLADVNSVFQNEQQQQQQSGNDIFMICKSKPEIF